MARILRKFVCCHPHRYQLVSGDDISLPPNIRDICLTEMQAERVAEYIKTDFELVGLRLGLHRVFLDRCKVSHSTQHMQVFYMLNTWRQVKGRHATVQNLTEALQYTQKECQTDMAAILKLFSGL